MAKKLKHYAQKDGLGLPIPSTMMAAEKVPGASNVIEISQEVGLGNPHPTGLKYYIRTDRNGNTLPNSLFVSYASVPDAVELKYGKCISFDVHIDNPGDVYTFGLQGVDGAGTRQFKGTVYWGDGLQSEFVQYNNSLTEYYIHTYDKSGIFTVIVCVDKPELIRDVELQKEEDGTIISIRNIEQWEGIDELDIDNNNIAVLKINGLRSLSEVFATSNSLMTSATIINCPKLADVIFSGNVSLISLNLSECPSIFSLTLQNCALPENVLLPILKQLVKNGKEGGYINIQGTNMPPILENSEAEGAIQVLQNRGWEVNYNLPVAPDSLYYRTVFSDPIPAEINIDNFVQFYPFFLNSPTAVTYSVSPALPAGLNLTTDGTILGTPTIATPSATYTVTATNQFGSSSADLTFEVVITE